MSKPKNIRTCAYCGIKTKKSKLLRINLPLLCFDFYQTNNFRSFYVCQNIKCISRVLKKHSVNKYLNKEINDSKTVVFNAFLKELSSIITRLFENNNLDDNNLPHYSGLLLYKNNVSGYKGEAIPVSNLLYMGNKDTCFVSDSNVAKRLLNYKNIIIDIDGFNGELNGCKKS